MPASEHSPCSEYCRREGLGHQQFYYLYAKLGFQWEHGMWKGRNVGRHLLTGVAREVALKDNCPFKNGPTSASFFGGNVLTVRGNRGMERNLLLGWGGLWVWGSQGLVAHCLGVSDQGSKSWCSSCKFPQSFRQEAACQVPWLLGRSLRPARRHGRWSKSCSLLG